MTNIELASHYAASASVCHGGEYMEVNPEAPLRRYPAVNTKLVKLGRQSYISFNKKC